MNLDEMLSEPLPAVADNGFSARVLKRVRADERRRVVQIAAIVVAVVAVITLLLPVQTLTAQLNAIVVAIGSSAAVGLAAAALVLTLLADRQFFRM